MLRKIKMSGTAKQVCYGLITLLMYVAMGVNRCYVAFLFHQLDQPDSIIHLTNDEKTWIGSAINILAPVGSLVSGYLMDTIGRKTSIALMFVPFLVSWILVSVASSYGLLFLAMILTSVGFGMGVSIIPYMSEISIPKYRGILLAMLDTTLNLGVILCSILMYFLKWNIVSIIFAILSLTSLLLTLILPESPIWLYSKGKKDEAIKTLKSLRSKELHQLQNEIRDMEQSFEASDRKNTGSTLQKCLRAWRQFLICVLIFLLISLAGPLLFLAYSVHMINELRTPYGEAKLAVIYAIAGFCGSFSSPFAMHNLKRKVMLAISAIGMTISMFAISLYESFYLHTQSENKPYVWILPLLLCLYNFLSNMGVFPLGFTLAGEIFPPECRGTLQGFYGFFFGTAWTISVKFYPIIMFDFGITVMLWCFTIFSALIVLYAIFILPETYGKTLNEVQDQYFNKKVKDKQVEVELHRKYNKT